jgi:hypothetical protein
LEFRPDGRTVVDGLEDRVAPVAVVAAVVALAANGDSDCDSGPDTDDAGDGLVRSTRTCWGKLAVPSSRALVAGEFQLGRLCNGGFMAAAADDDSPSVNNERTNRKNESKRGNEGTRSEARPSSPIAHASTTARNPRS